jgi:hypothetical protein
VSVKVHDAKLINQTECHVQVDASSFPETTSTEAKNAAIAAAARQGLSRASYSGQVELEMLDVNGRPIPESEILERTKLGMGPVTYRATIKVMGY